jgi:hypothetical protein
MYSKYFTEKWIIKEKEGCWIWKRFLSPKGYGWTCHGKANRLAFKQHKGDIPEGLHVLHTCDNRACVNPDHLYLGTNLDNVRDRISRGRQQDHHGKNNPNYRHGGYIVSS